MRKPDLHVSWSTAQVVDSYNGAIAHVFTCADLAVYKYLDSGHTVSQIGRRVNCDLDVD
jgi:hypothetical protein